MQILEKHKISLSLAILALGTSAVFYPVVILLFIVVALFTYIIFRSPTIGIIISILATTIGEFGRLEIFGASAFILDLIAPAVLLIWLIKKLAKKESLNFDRSGTMLILFIGIAIFSLLLGSLEVAIAEIKFSALHLIRFISIAGLFFVARDTASKRNISRIINYLLLTGILLALGGFYLFTIFPDFTEAGLTELGWDPHIGRLSGTWFDPNLIAGAFTFLLALLGSKLLLQKKLSKKIILLLVAGILLTALFLTYSRSGLLALGVSGLLLGLVQSRKLLIGLLVIGILGIFVSERLAERVDELTQSVSSLSSESQQVLDPTAELRTESWQEGLRVWQENPIFGTGYGAYKFHQNFTSEDSHAVTGSDSSLLNVAAMTGTIGLVTFLIFLFSLVKDAWSARKTTIGLGFLAGVAGLLVHSIFVNSLLFPPLMLYFFIVGGLLVSKSIINSND